MNAKEEIVSNYKALCAVFGVGSRSWDGLHLRFSQYVFCPENRLSLVGEYLMWQDFIIRAKEFNIPYYQGIDDFLKEYREAVMNCTLKEVLGSAE